MGLRRHVDVDTTNPLDGIREIAVNRRRRLERFFADLVRHQEGEAMLTKLQRLVAIHGWGGVWNLCLARMLGALLYFSPARRTARRALRDQDRKFDRTWGVDTSGMLIPAATDVVGDRWLHGSRYQGICVDTLRQTLIDLELDWRQYTFVDLGSGKGRAVMLAAQFPFRRVVGVEYSRPLHDAARRNLEIYPASARQCGEVDLVCGDAAEIAIPDGPLVLFLYNPFGASVMTELVQNVAASFHAHPRRIIALYFYAACADVWRDCPGVITVRQDRALSIFELTPSAVTIAKVAA